VGPVSTSWGPMIRSVKRDLILLGRGTLTLDGCTPDRDEVRQAKRRERAGLRH